MRRGALQDLLGQRGQPALRGLALVAAVVVVGILVYRQVDRWRGQVVTAWVAAADLEAGTKLAPEHLAPVELRKRSIPAGSVVDQAKITGNELLRPKQAGGIFNDGDLKRATRGPGPGLAGSVPEGRVLMAYTIPGFPVDELANMLRLGDRLDVFAFRQGEPLHIARDSVFLGLIRQREEPEDDGDETVGRTLASTLTEAARTSISAPSGGGGPTPILLAVRPEDVRRLVWAKNSGLPLTAVLHGKHEAESGELLGFPAEPRPRASEIEVILGASRERLPLENLQ